jgi:hypothetical protein
MRGLDPRIHLSARANGGMDRRVKPGDESFFDALVESAALSSLCLSASVVIFSYGAATRR